MASQKRVSRLAQAREAFWRRWPADAEGVAAVEAADTSSAGVPDDGSGLQHIALDYPVDPVSRQTWRPHPELDALIGSGRARYRAVLDAVLELQPHLRRIPPTPEGEQPGWYNGWLPALDSAVLYTALAAGNPGCYLEIGSGNSTKFARRAIRDHGLRTRLLSIDPAPRAEVDRLCDEVVRAPLENADLAIFGQLQAGDIVFLDGSHRVFTNSDTTVALLEVLPRLPAGVLLQIHDIFLPYDYPDVWRDRWYSEQYLLAAWLLGRDRGDEVAFPSHFVTLDPELSHVLDPLWRDPALAAAEPFGHSFWLRCP